MTMKIYALPKRKMSKLQARQLAITEPGTVIATMIKSGLDADKPISPSIGSIYIATDTTKTYACYAAGTWTQI